MKQNAKYPKTPHLPWSPNCRTDDKKLKDVRHLLNHELVLTEKMDGANVCMTRQGLWARSHEAAPRHWTYDYAKRVHGQIKHLIPPDVSVFCEYLYAVHSVEYDKLPDYLMVFALRDDLHKKWASWPGVVHWADKFKLPTVPVLGHYGSIATPKALKEVTELNAQTPSKYTVNWDRPEGVVVRRWLPIQDADFKKSIAKWVRLNHVQPGAEHWMHRSHIKINKLAPKQ